MRRLAFIGAGLFGQQALEIAKLQGTYDCIGFYDDFSIEHSHEGLPILGKTDQVYDDFQNNVFEELFIAIGYKHLKKKQEQFQRFSSIPFATLIHPTATIEESAVLAGGNLIYAKSYVGPRCVLELGSVLNVMSYLTHDITLGTCSFTSGGINIGGFTHIGQRCFLGLSTTVNDHITICDDVFLGSGAVVHRSIEEPGVYVGTPAKKIRDND